MKFLKWTIFLILALIIIIVSISMHPETIRHLENNFRNNVIRSFEESDMPTQLHDPEISFWPFIIKWPFLNIARNSDLDLPNSWLKIFQSIKFLNCNLSINPGWFSFNAELQCEKIDVRHLILRWFHVSSLNTALSKDFYFLHSDFRNLEGKQGWWNITVKADKLILNGKIIRSFHLNYYFSSPTQLVIEWPNMKEKVFLINEPEQLKVVHIGKKENYSFLIQSLYAEIKSVWENSM